MTEVSVVGPGDGEVIQLAATQMRILEDGHSTEPVPARSRSPRIPKGHRSIGTPSTTKASTWSRAR